VLEPEVAVAVPHAAARHARAEQRCALAQEVELPSLDLLDLARRQEVRHVLAGLREVLAHVDRHRLGRAEAAGVGVAARLVVEARQARREGVEVRAAERGGGEPHVGARLVGEAHHAHRPVDEGTLAGEPVAPIDQPHRDHAEVDVGREPPVERHLGLAGLPPLLEGAKVEEAQLDRLLDLVGLGVRQEDPGVVGLAQLDPRRLGKRRRVAQIVAEPSHAIGPAAARVPRGDRTPPPLPASSRRRATVRPRSVGAPGCCPSRSAPAQPAPLARRDARLARPSPPRHERALARGLHVETGMSRFAWPLWLLWAALCLFGSAQDAHAKRTQRPRPAAAQRNQRGQSQKKSDDHAPPPGDKSTNVGAQGRINATEDASRSVESPLNERRP
jgi:hypothetical protein